MLGRPVVSGLQIPVDEVLEKLAESASPDLLEGMALHPALTAEAVRAALRYAADSVRAASPIEEQDPLRLHGVHRVLVPGPDGVGHPAIAIRTFAPGAERVTLGEFPPGGTPGSVARRGSGSRRRPGRAAAVLPMKRVHPAGVFEVILPGEMPAFAWRLAITYPGGRTVQAVDPYSLPPVATEEALRSAARSYGVLGAHPVVHQGLSGVAFAVWAPNAAGVSLIGDFNGWDGLCHPMRPAGKSGVWEIFVPGLAAGERYKYRVRSRSGGGRADKADPYAFAAEVRPKTASLVWGPGRHRWNDDAWLSRRARLRAAGAPISIYEVHLGSWRRKAAGPDAPGWLSYRELAATLIPYVRKMGCTHIELMPVAEHPFDGSWGYQVTGYFAPTSRHGSPDDFRHFIDKAHQAGLGVILDWVPGHFPKDGHGLAFFDGTPLYEHPDPRRRENLEWGTSSFDLDRAEVREFLISNALFWLEQYHADGLRVDAVSSMVYLDYSRQHWVPNRIGGRENLGAMEFLRDLNGRVHREFPGVLTFAEESTAWPHVTGGGPESLGFDFKWNLGWMHDTVGYVRRDPAHRRHHHNELTFSLTYAFSEHFLLPFSHDEVVHGKRSMLSKMPGNDWQRFANLRALYGYLYAHPGKKLQFMGNEFGQPSEWNHDGELDWSLLESGPHRGLQDFVRDLNRLYVARPALHERDSGWEGFQWIRCDDKERSIVSFLRRGETQGDFMAIAANFTPVPREGYLLGVPACGDYSEALNSDASRYGGSGVRNRPRIPAAAVPADGQPFSIVVTLPPLAVVFFAPAPARRIRD